MGAVPSVLSVAHLGRLPCRNQHPLVVNFAVAAAAGCNEEDAGEGREGRSESQRTPPRRCPRRTLPQRAPPARPPPRRSAGAPPGSPRPPHLSPLALCGRASSQRSARLGAAPLQSRLQLPGRDQQPAAAGKTDRQTGAVNAGGDPGPCSPGRRQLGRRSPRAWRAGCAPPLPLPAPGTRGCGGRSWAVGSEVPGDPVITCGGAHGVGCPAGAAALLSGAPAGSGEPGARGAGAAGRAGREGEVDGGDEPVGGSPAAA